MSLPFSTGRLRVYRQVKGKVYRAERLRRTFLEILDKRVNKGTGVKSLAEALGI